MKWTRGLLALLLLSLIVIAALALYPFVYPVAVHPPKQGWLIAIINNIVASRQTPLRGNLPYLIIGIGCLMLLVMAIDKRMRKSRTYGTAHPATRREYRPFVQHSSRFHLHVPHFRRKALPPAQQIQPSSVPHLPSPLKKSRVVQPQPSHTISPSKLFLGWYRRHAIFLNEKQMESNALVVAPIGMGKTSRVVAGNLLREEGNRSLFIPDVKGELQRISGGWIALHHDVWVFDPVHPAQSEGYNPLAHIHSIEDAQEFAMCWVLNTGKSREEFWIKAPYHLMTATLMHVKAAEPNAPFSRVGDILSRISYDKMKHILVNSPSHIAREEMTAFFEHMNKNQKLEGTLMADVATRFQLLASEHIREVTAHNHIDFQEMAKHPIALYLSIPRRYADRYQPLLACFMMQMFSTWEAQVESYPDGHLPRRILCYMDEFTNLGYIPNMSGYISTLRHTGVGMLLAVQSFAQLDEKYGKAVRESILTNTMTHLLLPGAGLEETEYYSKRMGMTTVPTETHSVKGYGLDAQDSWTRGETGRRLMLPDELRIMAEDEMLMLHATTSPMLLKTIQYFRDRRVAHRANLPFHHVRVYQEPPEPPKSAPPHPPSVVESQPNVDQKKGNDQFFLNE